MAISVPVSLLVAEELGLLREGICALCESRPWLHLIAQCATGPEALEAIQRWSPRLAILADDLPDMPAVEILRALRQDGNGTHVVVLAANTERKAIAEVLRRGAHAVVLKNSPGRELMEALEAVLAGRVFLSPALELDTLTCPEPVTGLDPLALLSQREFQVFSLLVQGVRAKVIAGQMALSPKTVDTYRSSLMRKLDIHDVAGLVKFAIHCKLIVV